jgi:hypothetical protein
MEGALLEGGRSEGHTEEWGCRRLCSRALGGATGQSPRLQSCCEFTEHYTPQSRLMR